VGAVQIVVRRFRSRPRQGWGPRPRPPQAHRRPLPRRPRDSELGEIPESWAVCSVYTIADVVYGAPFSSAQFNSKRVGIPLLRIRDLATENPTVWTSESMPKAHKVRPGDIVVGMDGEFRAYLWEALKVGSINECVCLYANRIYSAAFVRSSILKLLADVEATEIGTTVIHLGKADIDDFTVVIPAAAVNVAFNGSFEFRMGDVAPSERLGASAWS